MLPVGKTDPGLANSDAHDSSDHLPQDDVDMSEYTSSADVQQSSNPSPSEHRSEGATCNSAIFETALQSAFNRTDAEFGLLDSAALVGTTAVVTLVGSRQLYIANCGEQELPSSSSWYLAPYIWVTSSCIPIKVNMPR